MSGLGLIPATTSPASRKESHLKLLYALHEERGTLAESEMSRLCPQCDLSALCPKEATLSVFCLEGIFTPPCE